MLESTWPALEVRSLRTFVAGRPVLDGVDLDLDVGQSLAIVGPSGSGKTTLLMALAGIGRSAEGTIRISGKPVETMSDRERAAMRLRKIGVVYQFAELLPELTPLENVVLPALMAGVRRNEAYTRASSMLRDLGVDVKRLGATSTLSGGERQRVAVGRALINRPALVLADEPTGALDAASTESVADLLFDIPKTWECALAVVTHNNRVAARADRIVELQSGLLRVVEA